MYFVIRLLLWVRSRAELQILITPRAHQFFGYFVQFRLRMESGQSPLKRAVRSYLVGLSHNWCRLDLSCASGDITREELTDPAPLCIHQVLYRQRSRIIPHACHPSLTLNEINGESAIVFDWHIRSDVKIENAAETLTDRFMFREVMKHISLSPLCIWNSSINWPSSFLIQKQLPIMMESVIKDLFSSRSPDSSYFAPS
jgi:hypothetical protein